MEALRDSLQTVFCPPLDTSLLAVFMADLEAECEANNTQTPSPRQISKLRQNLAQLATLAEEQNYYNEVMTVPDTTPSDNPSRSISYSSDDTPEWSSGDITTTSSSDVSDTKQSGSTSPVGFLRAIFPHMDVAKLRAALARSGDNDLDMEAIVEELLTSEHILEIQERDLDMDVAMMDDEDISWNAVKKARSKKASPALTVQISKKPKNTKMAITDVMQRQNHAYSSSGSRGIAAPDPWSQLTSLATHLATLLPSHSALYFQSAFHSPQHSTPARALRSCLASIGSTSPDETDKIQLFGMFDVLRSSSTYYELTSEQRDQVLSDARIALRATQGNPDQALELVELLLDLETELDLGVYHTKIISQSPTKSKYTTQLPSGPPPIMSPRAAPSSPTSPRPKGKVVTSQWQSVPERKAPQGPHPLAASIPAYNPGRKGKIKGSGNGIGKGGKGDVGELTHGQRMARLQMERNEVLREATRYWKNGGSGNRGGEVAMYFAERARDLQTQAREEALDAAREMVMSKRNTGPYVDTVDLHGTTVAEAIAIVQEMLLEKPSSNSHTLKIITGKGTHSHNKSSVLKPAIRNALTEQGWDVGTFEGGLVVRGRT